MNDDEQVAGRLAQRLRARAQDVEPATQRRLLAARERALAELPRAAPRVFWPAGVAAAAVVLLAVAMLWRAADPLSTAPTPAEVVADGGDVDDLEILYADEDLELIEDLEFFRWLTADGEAG